MPSKKKGKKGTVPYLLLLILSIFLALQSHLLPLGSKFYRIGERVRSWEPSIFVILVKCLGIPTERLHKA